MTPGGDTVFTSDHSFVFSADSPFHCVHVAWDSYLEKRSSGRSFLHNSHPSCTGLDLEEYKMLNYDKFMVQHLHYSGFYYYLTCGFISVLLYSATAVYSVCLCAR